MFSSASTRIPLFLSLTDNTSKLDGTFTLVEELEMFPLILIGVTVKLTALDSGFVINKNNSASLVSECKFLGKPTTNFLPALDEVSSRINVQFKDYMNNNYRLQEFSPTCSLGITRCCKCDYDYCQCQSRSSNSVAHYLQLAD